MPAPAPTVDVKRITEQKDATLARIKEQPNLDPNVQTQLDSIRRELCGQYNRLIANPQGMHVYTDFIKHCRKIEELINNMAGYGSAFVAENHFQQILDELKETRCPFGGGFRQETSVNAFPVHGVASSDDVAAPHSVAIQNPINIRSSQHVITSWYTEAPPCDTKVEVDEKKCLPDMFENGDNDMLKDVTTTEELVNLFQVELRKMGLQDKADESKCLEKELNWEPPATYLHFESQYQDDTPLMEEVEDSSNLLYNETNECVENMPPTELTTLASLNAPVSLGASLNHATFDSRSPIDIHSSTVRQGAFVSHGVAASSNFQQESVPEEFNEPDIVMEDVPMSNACPDLDESFSKLSGFSLDVSQVTDKPDVMEDVPMSNACPDLDELFPDLGGFNLDDYT